MAEVEIEQTQEQVAATALAAWRAAKDAGPGEASMRQQLQASNAVRQRRESDARIAAAHKLETDRALRHGGPPPPPLVKTPTNEWEAREAEIEAEHKQAQSDRAAAESNRKEQEQFLAFAKGRYELARKNGDQARADVWYKAAERCVEGKFLHHRVVNADPYMMKYQGDRARLAYQGKVVQE